MVRLDRIEKQIESFNFKILSFKGKFKLGVSFIWLLGNFTSSPLKLILRFQGGTYIDSVNHLPECWIAGAKRTLYASWNTISCGGSFQELWT